MVSTVDDKWHERLPVLPPSGPPTPSDIEALEYWSDPSPPPIRPKPTKLKLKPFMLSPTAPMFSHTITQSPPPPPSPTIPEERQPSISLHNNTVLQPRKARRGRIRKNKNPRITANEGKDALKLHLSINLEVEVAIKASVHGDVTLTLM